MGAKKQNKKEVVEINSATINSIPIETAIRLYIEEKVALDKFSSSTVKCRTNLLSRMSLYLKSLDITHTDQVDKNALVKFIATPNRTPNTKRTIIESLRSFFDWLNENEYAIDNVAARIETPKRRKIEQPVLFDQDIESLLETVIDATSKKLSTRNLLIVSIILSIGLRVEELIKLNVEDVDLKNKEFKVVRKGGKEVFLPFSDQISEMLASWLLEREQFTPTNTALFISNRGGFRLCIRAVQHIVKKNLATANLAKKQMGPHLLRRTAATKMAGENDLKTVQEILGHENITTTALYVKTNKERMRNAVEARLPIKK